MDRQAAAQTCRDEMNKHGLTNWGVRLNQNADAGFLGMCMHRDKVIILSAHHIDIHPDPDVINTIRHEIAHALTPGHSHDEVWADKAREIGCDNVAPCSNLTLSPAIIDAIRSGADVEVTFTEQVIRTPKYTITRLQDKCEICGKVAKTVSEQVVENDDDERPNLKITKLDCGHIVMKRIPKGTPFHKLHYGGDDNCQHAWKKNECMLCGRFKPFDFQIDGMRFLEQALAVNSGGAIFDEMGLGKTIQANGVVYFHQAELTPCLQIVKSGIKYQAAMALMNWGDESQVPQVINSSKDWLIPGLKHYIIGYDMLVPKVRMVKGKEVKSGFDITQFDRVGIKCVILDECQQIKNPDSTRTQMVRKVCKGRKVIALSGTPWKNRGSELFPVYNMLAPSKFWSFEDFKRRWVDTYWQGNILKEGGIKRIAQFKEYTKDISIRRERTEVMSELPLVNRTKLYVQMSQLEEELYDEAVDEFVKWYETEVENMSGIAIIAAMQKMRHLVAQAKVPATMDYMDDFVAETDRKMVIFAHHKDVQQFLYDDCVARYSSEIPVFKLTSEMGGQARYETQEAFNKAPRAILVASQLAAGEGLNLQTCADCIMHERQWNPGNEEQAEGRFIRIGQTAASVNAVYAHLTGLTTIDPQLDAIVERKRHQFYAAMSNGETPRWSEDSIMKELAETIVRAHKQKKAAA